MYTDVSVSQLSLRNSLISGQTYSSLESGECLRLRENHTGQGFCSHIRTVVSARFL